MTSGRPSVGRRLRLLAGMVIIGLAVGWAVQLAQPDLPADGSADAGFARDMAVHHAQAVEMAELEQSRTHDPDLEVLARDISLTQQAQIGRLRGWLDQWGLRPTSTRAPMAWMDHADGHGASDGHEHAGSSLMPGMATPLELQPLRSGTSTGGDTAFLRLMIRHHQGGIAMADAIADKTDRSEVRRFAEMIAASQQSEVGTLTTLLQERGGVPLPPVTMAASVAPEAGVSAGTVGDATVRYLPLAAGLAAAMWLVFGEGRRPRPSPVVPRPGPAAGEPVQG